MAIDPKRLYLNECKKFTIEKKNSKKKKIKEKPYRPCFQYF